MELNKIIYILKNYTYSENSSEKNSNDEIKEQDAAGGSSAAPYPTVTKWETGLNRSVANQIDYKVKWKDLYKITRGKSNTLL